MSISKVTKESENVTTTKCPDCDKEFKNIEKLKSHIHWVHEDEEVACDQCEKTFKNKANLGNHERIHQQVDGVEFCDQCSKSFKTKRDLYHHKNAVHTVEIIKCHICNVDSKNQYAFKKHFRKCSNKISNEFMGLQIEKNLPCPDCWKSFSNNSQLKIHVNVVHTKIANESCPMCEETFIFPYKLKNHMVAKHGMQKDFVCDTCKLAFISEGGMKHHNCGFGCKTCGQKNASKYELQKHVEQTHSNKLYNCDQCGKELKSKQSLTDHVNIKHEGIIAFSCETCGKSFSRSSSLKVHTITHSREMPYSCNICDKKYSEKKPVQKHMNSVHGVEYSHPPKVQMKVLKSHDEPKIFLSEYFKEISKQNVKQNNIVERKEGQFTNEEKTNTEPSNKDIGHPEDNPLHKLDTKDMAEESLYTTEHNKQMNGEWEKENPPIDDDEWMFVSLKEEETLEKLVDAKDADKSENMEVEKKLFDSIQTINQTQPSSYSCEYSECDYKYKYGRSINKHLINMHNMGYISNLKTCPHCEYTTHKKSRMEAHINGKHIKDYFYCEQCAFKTTWKHKLQKHLKTPHSTKVDKSQFSTICSICSKSFSTKCNLTTHIKNVHSNEERIPITCEFCFKEYHSLNIKDHVRTHTNIKSVCEVCAKHFTRKNLLSHMKRVHSNPEEQTVDSKNCPCPTCDKLFANNEYLKAHVKTHTMSKSLCEVCEKPYSRKNLSAHMKRSHSNAEKQPVEICPCKVCGKTFNNKHYLYRHSKTVHAAIEDASSCNICSKQFSNKHFVASHKKAVHDLQTMDCVHCEKQYKNSYLLRKHVKKYHL